MKIVNHTKLKPGDRIRLCGQILRLRYMTCFRDHRTYSFEPADTEPSPTIVNDVVILTLDIDYNWLFEVTE